MQTPTDRGRGIGSLKCKMRTSAREGEVGLDNCRHLRTEGRGVGKRVIFVDNPLRGSVSGHGSILGFGSLEKVKNHCSRSSHCSSHHFSLALSVVFLSLLFSILKKNSGDDTLNPVLYASVC